MKGTGPHRRDGSELAHQVSDMGWHQEDIPGAGCWPTSTTASLGHSDTSILSLSQEVDSRTMGIQGPPVATRTSSDAGRDHPRSALLERGGEHHIQRLLLGGAASRVSSLQFLS